MHSPERIRAAIGLVPPEAGREIGAVLAPDHFEPTEYGFALLVSDEPGDEPLIERMRRHFDVLCRAAERTTVLPLAAEERRPVEMALPDLAAKRDQLANTLHLNQGLVEVTLRLTYDESEALHRWTRGFSKPRSEKERAALGQAIAERLEGQRHEDRSRLYPRLNELLTDAAERPCGDFDCLSISGLLHRDEVDAFEHALDNLVTLSPLRLTAHLVAPLPLYTLARVG